MGALNPMWTLCGKSSAHFQQVCARVALGRIACRSHDAPSIRRRNYFRARRGVRALPPTGWAGRCVVRAG